ncbi:uncharacterized protein C5L36_0D04560 [Pichia kudriavzevii]|mgnify:CR=1 FL=1|uniref:Uncharacterized protein n=1 Tax=Pichia kudriavzevii TaxID=4909 RepID=A0A2U9RA28_PICKU|nr:uncharacterized protein C5L36_0D04560 [Pichia kudriavzevii]AWU77729.1 hypothetical protein C5L36_0D04560 [Pichia kudriavzevii]
MENSRERQLYQTLKTRYVGLGDADTTRGEYLENVKRDTLTSLVGHDCTLTQISYATGKTKSEVRFEILNKMCGGYKDGK